MKLPDALRPRKISLKLFLVVLPIAVGFSALVVLIASQERQEQASKAIAEKADVISHMTSFGLGPALFFEDPHTIEEVVQSARQNRDLTYIVVLNASGQAVAEFNKAAARREAALIAVVSEKGYFSADEETYHFAAPVIYEDRQVGSLHFGLSFRDALTAAATYRRKLILLGLGLSDLLAGGRVLHQPCHHEDPSAGCPRPLVRSPGAI